MMAIVERLLLSTQDIFCLLPFKNACGPLPLPRATSFMALPLVVPSGLVRA